MKNERGFTLLEVLVASLVMAIAVGGLLANLSTSLRNGARLTDADRVASIARTKMDELMLMMKLPHNQEVSGPLPPELTGWQQAGWKALVQPYDVPPNAAPGYRILERIRLEIWWDSNGVHRTFALEGYRVNLMRPGDVQVRP